MEIKKKQKEILNLVKIFDKVCIDNNINYTLAYGSVLGAVRHKGFIPWDSDMDVLVPINEFELMRKKLIDRIKAEDNLVLHLWDKEKNYCELLDRLSYKNIRHEILHLDIFIMIGCPSNKIRQKLFYFLCFSTFKFLRCKHCNVEYSKQKHKNVIKFLKIFASFFSDKMIIRWYNYLLTKYDLKKSEYGYVLGSKKFVKKDVYYDTIRVRFEDTKLNIPKKYKEYLTIIYGSDYMKPKKY